jgi:serine/threonine-protein kinase
MALPARPVRGGLDSDDHREGKQLQPGRALPPDEGLEIGRRTFVRLLGGGERYEAWLGWDDHLLAPVVIKILRAESAASDRSRRAIAREASLLKRLAHPGMVRMLGADLDAERPYLVLELLEGPRLSTLLRRFGPLSPEQLVSLATELAAALGYMHNERLLHLDVKPQNVIMAAPPKLIDLSIARSLDDASSLIGPIGTEGYMAPEQAMDGPLAEVGPWTDAWGLGVTLFEAANGYRPFEHGSVAPFHARVPAALASLIAACLAQDPAARPTMPQVLASLTDMADDARQIAQRRLRRRSR